MNFIFINILNLFISITHADSKLEYLNGLLIEKIDSIHVTESFIKVRGSGKTDINGKDISIDKLDININGKSNVSVFEKCLNYYKNNSKIFILAKIEALGKQRLKVPIDTILFIYDENFTCVVDYK